MSHPFRPEPEASAELEHAALWYEHERSGLGTDFLDAIDATLDRIAQWPDAAPCANARIRITFGITRYNGLRLSRTPNRIRASIPGVSASGAG